MTMRMNRRDFLRGAGVAATALVAAPALTKWFGLVEVEETVLQKLDRLWTEVLMDTGDAPDYILVSEDVWMEYRKALTEQQRFVSTTLNDIPHVRYRSADMIYIYDEGPGYIRMCQSKVSLSDLLRRTLRKRDKKIAENITKHNALLRRLAETKSFT